MSYYHVRIPQKGRTKDAIELNLSEKKLVNLILEKLRLRVKFACGNELVNPPDVLGIKITKSEKRLVLGHPDYYKLEYRDLWRAVENQEDVTERFAKYIPEPISEPFELSKNVFIVHGRDHRPMKELKAMLKEFGLKPVVLHEQPSGSRTIVEKLEKYSDVGYAFVILTPDDFGCSVEDYEHPKEFETYDIGGEIYMSPKMVQSIFSTRARQNVVLEFGYFIGLLHACMH